MTIQPTLPDSLAAVLLRVNQRGYFSHAVLHQRLHELWVCDPEQVVRAARHHGLLADSHYVSNPPELFVTPAARYLAHSVYPDEPEGGYLHQRSIFLSPPPPLALPPAYQTARLSYFAAGAAQPSAALTLAELYGRLSQAAATPLHEVTAAVTAAPDRAQGGALAQKQDRLAVGGLWTPGQGVTVRSGVLPVRVYLERHLDRHQAQALLTADEDLANEVLLLYAEPDQRSLLLLVQANERGWAIGWRRYQRLIEQRYRGRGLGVSTPPDGLSPEALFFVWADVHAYLHPQLLSAAT